MDAPDESRLEFYAAAEKAIRNNDAITAQCIRIALERVATKIEGRAGNRTYRMAWKIAAKIVRDNKPD